MKTTNTPSSQTVPSSTGFTLIELLTVIAIVAILAAILIPTIGKVRERANAATSISNLRQIGTAMNILIMEGPAVVGKGRYPAYEGQLGKGGGWAKFTWFDLVGEQLGFVSLKGGAYEWQTPSHQSIFQDPSHEVLFDHTKHKETASYGYNATGIGNWWANASATPTEANPAPALPINIEEPAKYVVVAESNGDGEADHLVWPDWAAAGVSDRYNGGGHYLFADGHVAWMDQAEVMANSGKYFYKINP